VVSCSKLAVGVGGCVCIHTYKLAMILANEIDEICWPN